MDDALVHGVARSLGVVSLCAVASTVGVRMLRLAQRTRLLPELAIGLHIMVLVAGYLIEFAGIELASGAAGHVLRAVGNLCYAIAVQVYLMFTWRVFRTDGRAAGAVVFGCTAMLAVGWLGEAIATDFDLVAERFALPWFWLAFAPRLVAMGWGSAEALLHHGRLKRRLRLGLVDPVISNQFLLWGIAAAAELMIYVVVGITIVGDRPDGFLSGTPSLWISGFGVAAALTMWLAFLPPRRYRAWIAGNA